jgi:hypothetical protein
MLLADIHPGLYHMAEIGTWPSIRRHGLLSTSAILDLAGIQGSDRSELEAARRPESVSVQVGEDTFVLRDQKPLSVSKLEQCLTDMTVPEWLRLLSSKVFFWPSRERCEQLLQARAYRDRSHLVIEIDTARLFQRR